MDPSGRNLTLTQPTASPDQQAPSLLPAGGGGGGEDSDEELEVIGIDEVALTLTPNTNP
jgi:hypothetical protein